MTLLFIYVFIALFFSFLCSLLEAVLLSIPYSYIALVEKQSPKEGKRLARLKENVDKPLSAILSLNTIAHTLGAAGAGAQAAAVFGNQYVGIISAVLTLLILVISEIIPKSLGASHWRRLARPVGWCLKYLVLIMFPFVWMAKYITMVFSKNDPDPEFCKEEFAAMAELGARSGKLKAQEMRIFRSLFRFNSLRVKDIMTPRTVVFALNQGMKISTVLETHNEITFSRIPVFDETIDRVTGYVMKDDILAASARGEHQTTLLDLKRDIYPVYETLPLPSMYEELLNRREPLCLVIDQYGGTAGIITLEDVVETLLDRKIMDESDVTRDMRALAKSKWRDRLSRLS